MRPWRERGKNPALPWLTCAVIWSHSDMRCRTLLGPALGTLGVLFLPHAVRAQGVTASPQPIEGVGVPPNLSLEPDALPHIEGTRVPGGGNWNAGAAVQILERPLAGRRAGERFGLIDYQLWTNYIAQLGIGSRIALGVEFPVMILQGGDLRPLGVDQTGIAGFGDLRATFRFTSRPQHANPPPPSSGSTTSTAPMASLPTTDNTYTGEGPGWSFLFSASAPTGDARTFTGNGAWIVHPSFVVDFRLLGFLAGVQVGYRARINGHWPGQVDDCDPPLPSSEARSVDCLATVPQRDAFTWSVGMRLPRGLLWGLASVYGEMMGAFDARAPATPNTTPIEMGLGLQRTFGEVTVTLGGYGGVTDVPGNPRFRGQLLVQWAPRFIDEDGDGLRDNTGEDQCPGIPEDRDGYQDNDGCPEDNDNDEVPDAEDRCPRVDEDADGFQDEDGCPDPDNDHDGVPDTQDQCRDVAMGANPDTERSGCPNEDIDGDGVQNTEDRCPEEPPGATPDPARPGCPAPDRDHDGVTDSVDACPDQPAGEGARPEQRGCPEPDRDHDGVLNDHDRCPDQAETINGFEDEDGCAEASPPRSARPRVRIVGAGPSAAGNVELLEPLRFTANDQVAPASGPLLAQLALALVATSRVQSRHWTITVAQTPPRVRGPNAVDAARAARRRDAVIAALRARGVPDWVVQPAEPVSAPASRVDRGIILNAVETPLPVPAPAPSTPTPNAPTSG